MPLICLFQHYNEMCNCEIENHSHCQASSLPLKEEVYLWISKNLDLSSSLTGRSFESRASERSGDLKNHVRAVSMELPIWLILTRATHSGWFLPSSAGVGPPFGADKSCWRKQWLENYSNKNSCVSYTFNLIQLLRFNFCLVSIWYGMVCDMSDSMQVIQFFNHY